MDHHRRTTTPGIVIGAAMVLAVIAIGATQAGAEDTTTSTSTTSTSTPATAPPPTTTIVNPLGPIRPLALAYDAAAGTIAIENPCSVSDDGPDAIQETYDLFLVPKVGKRTQLAVKQSSYATVPAYQTKVYAIPPSLPHGTYQVLLQCQAPPLTIQVEREQFASTLDWQGIAPPATPAPAAPVPGTASFTG